MCMYYMYALHTCTLYVGSPGKEPSPLVVHMDLNFQNNHVDACKMLEKAFGHEPQ